MAEKADTSRPERAIRHLSMFLICISIPIVHVDLGGGSKSETFAIAPITLLPRGTGIVLFTLGLLGWYVVAPRWSE